ncbi:MAG: hypothetical protein JNJ58_10680 [Chitinophagaceae bacterium]|nr:hypothetical protein [Chitinophagaceae bacterium]
MKVRRVIPTLLYYLRFIPFKINFFLFLIIGRLAYQSLKHVKADTGSFSGLLLLMGKMVFIFVLLTVGFSFLSALFCWIHFLWKKNVRTSSAVDITMDTEAYKNHQLRIITRLPFALRPALGFVKMKLGYDKKYFTETFILADRVKKQFISFRAGVEGQNTLLLPDIREYHFSTAILFFEDMLQFFSFPVVAPVHCQVTNIPETLLQKTEELPPKKTEEELVRIEQLRKVEGEHLNYKKFEDSDDVRRIVWKIFAKNKELVVRIPETMDPFASHIYLYASFFHASALDTYTEYQKVMLNRFKNCVWTIYDALSKKEFEVRYISDQTIHEPAGDVNKTQYTITVSDWHQDLALKEYFKPRSGSVLCIHSFTDLNELKDLLPQCDAQTTIFFVKLSKPFRSYALLSWISRIFLLPTKNHLNQLRSKWPLMPLRYQVLQQEKKIEQILSGSDLNVEIL